MFSSNNSGYSLADLAAVTGGNNGGWGGNNGWWVILLLLFGLGDWNNGGGIFGNRGSSAGTVAAASGALTRGELCQDMNFNDLQSGIREIQTMATNNNIGVLNGISQITSAIAGAQAATQLGFDNTNLAMVQNQNALANQVSGVNCDIRGDISNLGFTTLQGQNALATQIASQGQQYERTICDLNYNMATNTNSIQTALASLGRDITDNQNANTRAILQQMCDDKMAALRDENQTLKLAASQAAQNNYLIDQLAPKVPTASYIVPNPFTGTVYGNSGCGCMS